MPTNNTYPPLKLLFTENDLPEALGKFTQSISSIFNNVYYKEYYFEKTKLGDAASYQLTLVLYDRIAVEVPGTDGLALVLNPGLTPDGVATTEIPVSLDYKLEIVKYVQELNPANFASSPISYFDTLLSLGNLSVRQVIEEVINVFIDAEDPIAQFILDFNSKYPNTISYNSGTDPDVYVDLCIQIEENGQDTLTVLFDDYINIDVNDALNKIKTLFSTWFDSFDLEDILKKILVPQINASINEISLALEFPRSVFRPLYYDDTNDDNPSNNKLIGEVVDWDGIEYSESNPKPSESELANYKSQLTFDVGSLNFSTDNGLNFEKESSFSFQKSQIGNTGLTLYFKNMKLDLSRKKNIPEATAAGYDNDFVGVFVESAEIGLPEKWFKKTTGGATLAIFGENLLLGTGGISGKFGLKAVNASGTPIGDPADGEEMEFKIGGEEGFIIGFKQFDVTLLQGEFVETNIFGSLTIPGFKDAKGDDAKIEIEVSFDKDGDFKFTAKENDGFDIVIPNVFTFNMKTLSIGKEDGKFFISTSGAITFDAQSSVGKVFDAPLNLESLVIWEDGTIQLKGLDGALKLKEPKTLNLGPAKITITAVHFGTHEQMHEGQMRKYWFFGFDGGISINPGGVDARGDGIKMYFTVDNNASQGRDLDVFFRIQSIAIDLIIPGNVSPKKASVLINGYLSMKEPSPENVDKPGSGTEYIGGVSLSLPKVKLMASAAMRLNPSVPAFLVDISLSLPKAIPLGSTGTGIYGFRGLLGQKYVATKKSAGVPDDGSWYEYYKAKVSPDFKQGIQVSKFENKKGFSVGAGVSLATNFDSGKVFSSKIFFMLSLPDVLLLQGQGAILRQRIDLDTSSDPPFSAMIALSSSSIEAAFGINVKIPEETGKIATVSGLIEMGFFFGNAGAWYLNIGRENPVDKRVTARIFTLFNAYFYFMLSKQGISSGAGVNWEFKRKYGPVKVSAGAYLEAAGKVSFKPVQIGGSVRLGGHAELSVFGISLGISIDAALAAEASKPFILTGSLKVSIKIIKKFKFTIEFTWSFNRQLNISEVPLLDPSSVKAVNLMSGESYKLAWIKDNPVYSIMNIPVEIKNAIEAVINDYIIPVDSYIDFEFLKGMGLAATTELSKFGPVGQGANYIEFIPPRKGKSDQVLHTYMLSNIKLFALKGDGSAWVDYKVYEALTPLLPGYAPADIGITTDLASLKYGYWQSEDPGKYNKLRVLAQSSLSYVGQAMDVTPEEMGFEDGFLFCDGKKKVGKSVTFTNARAIFPKDDRIIHEDVLFRVTDADGVVSDFTKTFNLTKALSTSGTIEIFFLESYAKVDLILGSFAEQVRVTTYKNTLLEERDYSHLPMYEYTMIEQRILNPSELSTLIKLNDYEGNSEMREYPIHNPIDKITIESIGTCSFDGFLQDEASEFLLQENRGKLILEETNMYQCQTQLFGISMLNVTDYAFNITIPGIDAVEASANAMRKGFEACLQPIWRPDTIYRIEVQTLDQLNKAGRFYSHTYNFIFKTAGPLGHFHKYKVKEQIDGVWKDTIKLRKDYEDLQKIDREDQFKLASLKDYINMTKSYPNADGRLINAKPLFYKDPTLLVFYKYDYVYTMFNNFNDYLGTGEVKSNLQVLIKDPTEKVSDTETPTPAPIGENIWVKEEDPIIPLELQMINNLAENGVKCIAFPRVDKFSVAQQIKPAAADVDLKPDKLYTAVFNAVYKGAHDDDFDTTMIHSYVFKTSTYGDFKEQIQSYVLSSEVGAERNALFTIEKVFNTEESPTTIDDAIAILNNTIAANDDMTAQFADKYDRLVNGVLKVGVLPPAVTTDVNLLKNMDDDHIIGIIVRNPEPFNDPKIPDDILANTIILRYDDAREESFKVIYSKDKTMAFISNAVMNIQAGDMTLTFKYLQFNGSIYDVQSTESIGIEVLS